MLTNPPVPSRGLLRDCTTGCGTDGALHSTTQESSEVIRDLERELNISSGQLALSTTLHKLLLLTDVVLEASSSDSSKEGEKFMKSQVFLDSVRGRMRRLPLMFNSAQQMFQQR